MVYTERIINEGFQLKGNAIFIAQKHNEQWNNSLPAELFQTNLVNVQQTSALVVLLYKSAYRFKVLAER